MLWIFVHGWVLFINLMSATHVVLSASGDLSAVFCATLVGPAESGHAENGKGPPACLGGWAGQEEAGGEEVPDEGTLPALVKPTAAGGFQWPVPLSDK